MNGGNFGSASAGGAGNGAVQNGAAIGQGTGIANAGPGINFMRNVWFNLIHYQLMCTK